MFETKTALSGRLTDAVDLLIDFATLGEYGLEPVGAASASGCGGRRRQAARGRRERNATTLRGRRLARGA